MCRKTECSDVSQNGSFSPHPARSTTGILLGIYCGNLVKLLKVNLTILWGAPMTGSSLSFQLSVIYKETPAIHQLQFGFSYPGLVPTVVTACSLLKETMTLCVHLSLQSWGQWFVLHYPLLQIQEELLLFQSISTEYNFQASYMQNQRSFNSLTSSPPNTNYSNSFYTVD